MKRPQVWIVGGGFGGLNAARALSALPVDLTLVDRNNYHLFQPLLYQVATAGLSSVDVAAPIRRVLRKYQNIRVLMAEVLRIDPVGRQIFLQGEERPQAYDYLILAPGSRYNYFGHEAWEADAPSLKTIANALEIRRRILSAFERAERETDPLKQKACLTFVVVGGGPTGVELAGSIAELAHRVLNRDFRRIHTDSAQVFLVEAGPSLLAAFAPDLVERVRRRLRKMGVTVREHCAVEAVNSQGVRLAGEFLPAETVLWCAGVKASPLLASLGLPLDAMGRLKVEPDLSLRPYPDVFVIGDAAHFPQGEKGLPGLAPVAMQQGRHLAKVLKARLAGNDSGPAFRYRDKGQLATVGRAFAIAQLGRWKWAGLWGWLIWVFVHILYLAGFQNRALVLLQWAWQYCSFDRGARLISEEQTLTPTTASLERVKS